MKKAAQIIPILILLALSWQPRATFAQKVPPFLGIPNGNEIVLILTSTPARDWSFDVYRKSQGGAFKKITAKPVAQAQSPAQMQKVLGKSFDQIANYLDADDAFQVFRRLHSSAFKAGLLSLLDERVALALGRMFVDSNAVGAGPFTYKIVFLNQKGQTKRTFLKTISKRVVLPKAPTNLKADVSDGKVTLHWKYPLWAGNASDLAFQFNVYRKSVSDAKFKKINSQIIFRERKTDFSFTDTWLKNGRPYRYYVVAMDLLKREGQPSATLTVIPKDNVPPDMPKGMALQADSQRVRISWGMSPEPDVKGYFVYRAPSLRSRFRKISGLLPADAPFYSDASVEPGRLYFYRVAAIDSSDNLSKRSNPLSILVGDREPPVAPANVKVLVQKGKMVVTWTRSPSKDVAGYKIYFGEIKDQLPLITQKMLPGTAARYVDDGKHLVAGRTQFLAVTAVDSARNESKKQPVTVKIPDWQAPQQVAFLSVQALPQGEVKLTWGSSPSVDVTHYLVTRFDSQKKEHTLGKFPSTVHTWIDSSVEKGKTVTYAVVAVDSAGNKSEMRVKQFLAHDRISPPAPRDLLAQVTPQGVRVSWGRVIATDLAGFNVYRCSIPTGIFKKINAAPVKKREFLDTAGKKNLWYKVRAVDTSGNESAWKSAVQAR